jgi:electron transfer flavoprotein alpha subunit
MKYLYGRYGRKIWNTAFSIPEVEHETMGSVSRDIRRVLVLVDREGCQVASTTLESFAAGRKIANEIQGILCAAVIGDGVSDLSLEIADFADEVYFLNHNFLRDFQADLYAEALEQLYRNVNPDIVMMGHTLRSLDVAPRLAYRMEVQVITDCVDVWIEPGTGHMHCTKPVYGARVFAVFELDKKPYMLTLRPKAFEPTGPASTKGNIIYFNPIIEGSSNKVELIETIKEESISLNKAEAIVAGGRGVKNAEGLEQLKDLIKILGKYFSRVELGASRPLVDAHLVPSSRQIGLTGEKVAPEVYIAVGISGSMQHLTGISGAKKIVAINTNPKAPIFEASDYGVVGNYEDVVPAFKRKLEEL